MTEQKLSATDAALRRRITESSELIPYGQQWACDDGSIRSTVDATGRLCADNRVGVTGWDGRVVCMGTPDVLLGGNE